MEALQNEVIREVLNVRDISVLKKVKKMLLREDFLANFGQACKELKQNLEGKLEFKRRRSCLMNCRITYTPERN